MDSPKHIYRCTGTRQKQSTIRFEYSSRASKNMWKILVLAPVLFLLSNSEVISKRKTIPLSKETCPCWWDLEGTQIDPNTNEPYKCACCKSGKKICNYLMLLCRDCVLALYLLLGPVDQSRELTYNNTKAVEGLGTI